MSEEERKQVGTKQGIDKKGFKRVECKTGLVHTAVWLSPGPDHYRLSYLLIFSHSIFS